MTIKLAEHTPLGRNGLRVSRLALGTMTFGSEWGWGADKATARATLDIHLKAGGNGRIRRAPEGSLRRLRSDHVDLLPLLVRDRPTPVEEVARTLDDLVRSGEVRYVGLSNVPARYAARAEAIAEIRGVGAPRRHADGVPVGRTRDRGRARSAGNRTRDGNPRLVAARRRDPDRQVSSRRDGNRRRGAVGEDGELGQSRLRQVRRSEFRDPRRTGTRGA